MILQPFPRSAPSGIYRSMHVHIPVTGDLRYILPVTIGDTKKPHTFFRKNNFCVFLTSIVRSVFNSIHRIFRTTGPIEMLRVYAPSITTFMCCVSKILRARSVYFLADQPVNTMFDSIDSNARVASMINGKRPRDAVVGIRQKRGFDKFQSVHSAKHTHYASLVNGNVTCRF
jgi:hypothetical protein